MSTTLFYVRGKPKYNQGTEPSTFEVAVDNDNNNTFNAARVLLLF
jgi:hypothetical protein